MLAGKPLVGGHGLPHQLPDVDHLQIQAHFAGLDFFAVQNVVDQPDQALTVVLGNVDQAFGRIGQDTGNPAGNQPQRAANGGQRRTQFVADG